MPFTFIANSPYARDAVELGRVVVNVDSPLQEYFQPRAKPSVSHHNFTSIHDAIPASDRSRLAIYLSRLFTVSYDEVSDHAVVINTSAASTYELKNSTLWFDDLRASGKGRIWLSKQAASRRSLHLVVGYVVVKDVHIAQMDGTLSLGNIKLQIPPAALTGVGAAANTVISELGDVGIKIQHFSQQLQEGSFIASGEQILAIEYRTIRVGMFRSRDVDKLSLRDGSWWKFAVKGESEEHGGPDSVVADLVDETIESEIGVTSGKAEIEDGRIYLFSGDLEPQDQLS